MHKIVYLKKTNKTTARIERTATKPANGAIINIGFEPSYVSNGFEGTYSETNHIILLKKLYIHFLFYSLELKC